MKFHPLCRFITLSLTVALMVSACGIKPSKLDSPNADPTKEADPFPAVYPQQTSR